MTVEDTVAGPTRVMLVALPLMSWGLERLLEGDHGRWSVVGVVESAAEGVLRMEQIEPDVIVFDLDGEEGTESLAHLQAQTSAQSAAEAPFVTLIDWMQAHLDQPLDVPALAARAGLSERSFYRKFTDATGKTPAHFVESLRLDAARTLLPSSEPEVRANRMF